MVALPTSDLFGISMLHGLSASNICSLSCKLHFCLSRGNGCAHLRFRSSFYDVLSSEYSWQHSSHVCKRVTIITRHRASTSTRWHFAFALFCHSNATRAPIANSPNSAQLGGIPYQSLKLHPGPCNSVGMRPRTDRQTDTETDRHTDARDHNTFRVVYDSREM